MRWEEIDNVPCSVARSLSVIGDRWTLLIIRDCFYGTSRFDDFQKQIGMTRHILSDRLRKLVDADILVKHAYQDCPTRFDYFLTPRGEDLYPILMTIAGWGDKWMSSSDGVPVEYVHATCGQVTMAGVVCSECGEELTAETVKAQRGPGFPPARKPTNYARYIHQLETLVLSE